jgi:hypothetical protein
MYDRHIGAAVIKPFRVEPRLLPVIVEDAVRPLLEQIIVAAGAPLSFK